MKSAVGEFLKEKDSPLKQLIKYVGCGGLSVLIDQITFYSLAWLVFPAMRASDPVAKGLQWLGFSMREVSEAELARNYWVIKFICFIASNTAVYILNVLFVFKPGRHSKPLEILLFFGSSLFQFLFIALGGWLITEMSWEVTYANITMLLTAMTVNFIIRKKVVFKG
jgi:putative flippase GtrA